MKTNRLLITLVLFAALLLAGCGSAARVGALRTETQLVELGDARSVRVEINMGAGDLEVTGGALVVRQPKVSGMPALRGITGFQNGWELRLSDGVSIDLRVDVGGGAGDLQLAGLSLTALAVNLGTGVYTVDLSGDWARDLRVTIQSGAADISVRLPRDVGVRVMVDESPSIIEATGLTQDGNVYTNAAYGVSPVTMQVDLEPGIGQINLELEEAAATSAPFKR